MAAVPDFTGMNRQQASDAAINAGVYLQSAGNDRISPSVIASAQDIPAGTRVKGGTTVTVTFYDTSARD